MKLSEDLMWRGLIKDKSFDNDGFLDQPKSFYLGIDASADSLTVGNLAIILLALRLAKANWQAFLVMGGGTSLVGDPGGKTEERQLMSRETIVQNISGIRTQVASLFGNQEFNMVDNYDWLADLKYLEFIRDVGKHFSMTELMQRDFVSDRMGEGAAGISYTEFSYSLVQGYDFWHLFTKHGVVMQIGGSDQWGNMLSGVSLIRKKESKVANALSMPLIINKTTGVKFGKSEGGAVWLDPAKTSPTQFYQFWVNADDAGVEDYLKIYTELSKEEIDNIVADSKVNPADRVAQKALARAVTTLVHGQHATQVAEQVTDVIIGVTTLDNVPEGVVAELKKELPFLQVDKGASLASVLMGTQLASSNTEANRLIESKATYINGYQYSEAIIPDDLFKNNLLIIRRGKAYKDSALVELK